MIGGDVEQCRGPRAKVNDRLELEARQLDDEDSARRAVDDGRQRPSDVAAHFDGEAGSREQRPGHRCGRRLAVAAGDADHRGIGGIGASGASEKRPGELDLRDDRQALRHGLAQERMVEPDSRAHHDGVEIPGQVGGAIGEPELDARIARQVVGAELLGGAAVARHHLDAAAAQQARRGGSGQAEAEDEDALQAGGIEGVVTHRSLSVESAIRANITETIQKRTMIFGSAQPPSSK